MLQNNFLGFLSSLLNIHSFGFNLLDLIIVGVLLLYAYEGYSLGFIGAFFDFLSFVLSFAIGLKWYSQVSLLLERQFNLSPGFSHALGFFILAFVSEILLTVTTHRIVLFINQRFIARGTESSKKSSLAISRANHFLGILPGIASAIVLISFLLTIIISLPLSAYLKHIVLSSRFGNVFIANTQGFEKNLNEVFGGAIHETLNFLTVEPQSNEIVTLHFKTSAVSADEAAEQEMFRMVNVERASRGLRPLVFDTALQAVARAHSKDMFARGYFSHYTPDGLSPFDRMAEANISFIAAGENLALAPNAQLAQQGLMQSPGHRANILSTQFGKIGIGVMDGGIYGEMFTQEFKD